MKKNYLIGIIFLVIGILPILALLIFHFFDMKFQDGAIQTNAIIEKIEYQDVSVRFYDKKGTLYTGKLNYYSSSMRVGDKVEIFYKEDNPINFKAVPPKIIDIIFIIISSIFILLGLIFLLVPYMGKRKAKYLMQHGIPLTATIESVQINQNVSMNNYRPYIILASFLYHDRVYSTKSNFLWYDVKYILDSFHINELPVYVDINNPTKNYLDTSILEKYIGK